MTNRDSESLCTLSKETRHASSKFPCESVLNPFTIWVVQIHFYRTSISNLSTSTLFALTNFFGTVEEKLFDTELWLLVVVLEVQVDRWLTIFLWFLLVHVPKSGFQHRSHLTDSTSTKSTCTTFITTKSTSTSTTSITNKSTSTRPITFKSTTTRVITSKSTSAVKSTRSLSSTSTSTITIRANVWRRRRSGSVRFWGKEHYSQIGQSSILIL